MGIDFKGFIQTSNAIVEPVSALPKQNAVNNTFADLIKKSLQTTVTGVSQPTPIQPTKIRRESPVDTVSPESSNFIKPKYVEDKSISYKSSSYLKELLGEGK